jgi:mannose-1-phosphate guanylyltransferase
MQNYYAVIMAGGGGTRLWPLSRTDRPKQMLRLGSERTLFQIAIDRLDGLFPPERILVVTVAEQAVELQRQAPEIPQENYLLEPLPRGTASVVGLAAAALTARDPGAVMAVLTADHVIRNVDAFQQLLRSAYAVAQQDYLVTLGIQPTHPATGYGYIQQGERLDDVENQPVYRVERFKEKPDLETAQAMLAQRNHVWNSGMFIWRVNRIWAEFHRWMPALAEILEQIAESWTTPQRSQVIQALWPAIQPETIDYGIMEHAERVAVLPAADLGWSDIGSWDALFSVLQADENGNIILHSETLQLDASQSLILSENKDRLITTIGVRDLIIIDTGDVLLVCNRADAQKVRDAVNQLKKTGQNRYL